MEKWMSLKKNPALKSIVAPSKWNIIDTARTPLYKNLGRFLAGLSINVHTKKEW
jgi:hypothetical protein